MDEIILGVDVGTSTCQVALYDEHSGVPIPLEIGQDRRATWMPSTAFWDPVGKLLVGEDADNASRSGRPGIRLPSAKRYVIGGEPAAATMVPPWPGNAPKPDEVVRALLREVLSRARRVLEQRNVSTPFCEIPVHLSCPTHADMRWRDRLVSLCREWGMKHVAHASVIEEATCAALSYSAMMGLEPGEYLIYDYGGGTFDAAWIRVASGPGEPHSMSVIASEGDSSLGGDDLDRRLYDRVVGRIAERTGETEQKVRERLEEHEPVAGRRLFEEVRRAKHELSRDNTHSVALGAVQGFEGTNGNPGSDLALTREDVEELLRPDVDRTLRTVVGLLIKQVDLHNRRDPRGSRRLLQSVLLSGGMCSIPYVQARVRAYLDGVQLRYPRVATLQDCVAMGCSRPIERELSNRKHCSWSVSLVLSNGRPLKVFDPYEETFDWLTAHWGKPRTKRVRIPEGADVDSVTFVDARTGRCKTVPVQLPRDRSRVSWDDTVQFSYGGYGLCLKRGQHERWVTDLPWFDAEERQTRENALAAEKARREREGANHRAEVVTDPPYDLQDHR